MKQSEDLSEELAEFQKSHEVRKFIFSLFFIVFSF